MPSAHHEPSHASSRRNSTPRKRSSSPTPAMTPPASPTRIPLSQPTAVIRYDPSAARTAKTETMRAVPHPRPAPSSRSRPGPDSSWIVLLRTSRMSPQYPARPMAAVMAEPTSRPMGKSVIRCPPAPAIASLVVSPRRRLRARPAPIPIACATPYSRMPKVSWTPQSRAAPSVLRADSTAGGTRRSKKPERPPRGGRPWNGTGVSPLMAA